MKTYIGSLYERKDGHIIQDKEFILKSDFDKTKKKFFKLLSDNQKWSYVSKAELNLYDTFKKVFESDD